MADNELKIKVTIDKVSLEQVKAENRKLVETIKADSKKSVEQIKADNKLQQTQEITASKERIARWNLEFKEKQRLERQAATESKRLSKEVADQQKRDAEMTKRVYERQMNQTFGGKKGGKGNGLMYWSEIGENLTVMAAGIGMAFSKVQQFIGGAIEKSVQFEKSLQTLKFATDSITFKGLQDFNKNFQTKSVFSGKDIVNAEMFLSAQGRTEEQIKKTIQAAMDLSVVTGDDLDGAVRKLDMTYEGSIGRLGRLDDRVKGLTQAELENGAAVDLIGEKYRGFADKQADTMAGKIAILEKNFSALEKSLGDSIIKEVGRWFDVTNKSANDLSNTFANLKIAIDWVVSGFGAILRTVPNLYSLTKSIIDGFSALGDVWRFITDDSYKFADAMSAVFDKLSNVLIVGKAIKGIYNLVSGDKKDEGSPMGFYNTAMGLTKSFSQKFKSNIYDYGTNDATAPQLPERIKGTGRGISSDRVVEEKAILNEKQKQLELIQKIQEELSLNVGLIGTEIELNKKLFEAKQRLLFIESGINISKQGIIESDLIVNRNTEYRTAVNQNPFIQSKDFEVTIKQMIEPLNTAFGEAFGKVKDTFSNIADLFNLQADSFIGKMISGFDTVLAIINTIVSTLEAVNAVKGVVGLISSFIPGAGIIGGSSGGGDSFSNMPLAGTNQSINVFVNSELETFKVNKVIYGHLNGANNFGSKKVIG